MAAAKTDAIAAGPALSSSTGRPVQSDQPVPWTIQAVLQPMAAGLEAVGLRRADR